MREHIIAEMCDISPPGSSLLDTFCGSLGHYGLTGACSTKAAVVSPDVFASPTQTITHDPQGNIVFLSVNRNNYYLESEIMKMNKSGYYVTATRIFNRNADSFFARSVIPTVDSGFLVVGKRG